MSGNDAMSERLEGIGRRVRLGLSVAIVLVIAAATMYTFVTLNWAYSAGTRAGVLQKFSSKGWVCKTYEGELALYVVPGVSPEIWSFSVRDERVAEQVQRAVGQKVQLKYTEHRGVPSSCFAETRYFVDGVTLVPQ
jgi:hypothetical protein